MDIRVLKYFLAVVREENITKAADILHVTQPTLSRQLSKMEEDLGVQLFLRGKKGITLTEEGLLLRRRAEEIVELADKAERELTAHEELIDGEVSIGSGELASVQLLPELFSTFKERYPRVQFDLYTGNADQIKQRLDNGLTDIGILLEPVAIEKYDFIRFNIPERWVVLMRPDALLAEKESVTVEDLVKQPLIITKRQSVRNEIESWFRGHIDDLNIAATSNMSTNAAILVEQGFGYALVVEGSVSFLDTTKICYRPLSPERTTTSVLAWKKNQPFAPAVRKFLEHAHNMLDL
ncbi:MAG: LysR family transcriptional regulator [bacterium]|nr:LysR family transcriptional regulator [bacterium]